ncbi:PTS sugar transporter subunit IIB [Paucilactobacillus nenjiangensis]|jgi:PTS system ascorbate-specific IIB component|uniref:PTS ascorbate transporter subunit IIB n=1 Tax=Paucilactobacillus nenjiangensis TaxID=1296540 RepID=A0A5P1WY05_9LACO|nr:PTS ascorbate transporter subunit IIB [Paucilactobacillus nenjiangensis]QER66532.1 PTS ascorbate transporter subunit IIB [Paucilactobacillus nenjiangensis]
MKILVSCANGSGTSLMMMKSVQKSMKKLGIPITEINHTSISEGKSTAAQYDAVFTPLNFTEMFADAEAKGVKVVGVKNVMSEPEITKRIQEETNFEEKFKK